MTQRKERIAVIVYAEILSMIIYKNDLKCITRLSGSQGTCADGLTRALRAKRRAGLVTQAGSASVAQVS
jgi:hypothetical protein